MLPLSIFQKRNICIGKSEAELGEYEAERQIGAGNQYQYCNVVSVHCQDTNGSPVMCINLLVPIFPADRVLNLVNTNQSTTSLTSSIYIHLLTTTSNR